MWDAALACVKVHARAIAVCGAWVTLRDAASMRLFRSRFHAGVAVLTCAAALLFWLPAFREPFATGFGDWQFFMHMWEAGYVAIVRYGEWPLWDPYHCGGITIFGNPQSQHMSPLYALSLLAGPTLGSKLFIVIHAWAGFSGMFVLARRRGLSPPAAALASLAFAASGFFAWHIGTGHAAFAPFYFAPWVVLALRAAVDDVRYAVALAALMVLVLLEGGVYPFPYFLLLIAFESAAQLVSVRTPSRVMRALLVSGVLIACIGAIRLWPILDELQRSPRTMPSSDAVSLRELLEMLTARSHGWRWAGHEFVWSEYGCYVGWGVCALGALGGIVAATRRRTRWAVAGALLFLGLSFGEFGPLAPWSLLHQLPIYDSLRVPTRFVVLFTLYWALLSGIGLDLISSGWQRLCRGSRAWFAQLPAWMLVLALGTDLALVQLPTVDKWRDPPVRIDQRSARFYLTTLSYANYYASLPRMNLGSRECYEAMTFRPAHGLWVGDKPQARLVSGRGVVGEFERTTSRASFDVTLQTPGRVVVNQNHAPGWTSSVGTVVADRGRLAIDLPAGTHHVALVYRPTMLWRALALSVFGLLLAYLLIRFGRSIA